jgi:signal transduction histidine kinase
MADSRQSTLETADRLATLGTLVAGVAHEINNPISYVLANLVELEELCGALRESTLGYREALRQALGPVADARVKDLDAKLERAGGLELIDELIGDALEGAERIRGVVSDLLDVARPQAHPSAGVDLHELLDATLRVVRMELPEIERDYGATVKPPGDRAKLGQVFLNLVANAIDASPGGRIAVRTRDLGDAVEVEIEDDGPGIPPELEPELFTPFFTTKPVGTGLGLFISRGIVEQHRGTLAFRSSPTGGTIFRVTLPRAEGSR